MVRNKMTFRNVPFLLLFFFLFVSISVDAESVYLKVGDTKILSPSVLQTKVLAGQPAWTSSRPKDVQIVSTDMYSCKIEALNSFKGYAIVHCLYYYRELDPVTGKYIYQRSGYVDYRVFVEETEIKSIEISPTNIVLNYGDTHKMEVTILPSTANQNVVWTSSNQSVASVNSSNILRANGYGSAIVTATTSNGLTASCYVTVEKSGNGGNNSGNTGQSSANYDELDYFVQISKKRMSVLRKQAIRYKK